MKTARINDQRLNIMKAIFKDIRLFGPWVKWLKAAYTCGVWTVMIGYLTSRLVFRLRSPPCLVSLS